MKLHNTRHIVLLVLAVVVLTTVGCSTQKNTAKTRWWHAFNARYNTYYNGSLAYIDGSLEKENGNQDNFTELIPLYTVGNKSSRELGKANFDRAIEKCQKAIKLHSIKRRPQWTKKRRKTEKDIEWLSRREYNPFLWKAWMLMGRSQFHKGAFDDAASTFSYMSRLYRTQPAIYARARAWLAKCYVEEGWLYDAEDVIRNMRRDSIAWQAQKEWDFAFADYYIHTGDYAQAVPYLRKVIKHEMRRKQRAREWYLMGQLQTALGNNTEALRAYRRVIRQNPPYNLEFNARIAMTEVMSSGQSHQMIRRLKRMAASDKNKDYLDQVYYAIGNIYLSQKDTVNAISAYEKGNVKSTRGGIEKGVLLLRLGDLYWEREQYSDAKRCYGAAIGMLDKDRKDYKQLSDRSKVLDELVPYTEAVHLQDSLQSLAAMSEKDRNAAIDRVIEALKQKEREERRLQAEQEAAGVIAKNGGDNTGNRNNTNTTTNTANNSQGLWYFYNPMAVAQGKANFEKLWGRRENVDDWQRVNKTVVAMGGQDTEEWTDEQRDSIAHAEEVADSIAAVADSAQNDPHKREYYLAQIPFTPEQLAASNQLLEEGLYNSGVIFKDKLGNLPKSEKALRRLTDNYPDFERMADAYYHLFLLYSLKGETAIADSYVDKLRKQYPQSPWTTLLTDPYFRENSQFGEHIEDSIYAATYEAFKADRYGEVMSNVRLSKTRFPLGANRDKFIFIGGLSRLNGGDAEGCLADMDTLVNQYPKSKMGEMAGMIINGVKAGRRLHGGKFEMSDVWQRRSAVLNGQDSTDIKSLTAERNTDFAFLLVYSPDSVNENQLLFALAKYNFTSYMVRNFDIDIDAFDSGQHMMVVSGFRNYDEALQYARQLHAQPSVTSRMGASRSIVISMQNLDLLGRQYSLADYDQFYAKHFAPLKVSTLHLLAEPDEIVTKKGLPIASPTEEDADRLLDEGTFLDNGLDDGPQNGSTTVIPDDQPTPDAGGGTTVLPVEEPVRPSAPVEEDEATMIPVDGDQPADATPGATEIPLEEPAKPVKPTVQPVTPAAPVTPAKPSTTTPVQPTTQPAVGTSTAKPVTPAAKPATPAAKPASPTATPATPAAKPAVPAAKPATPEAKKPKNVEDEFYFDDDTPSVRKSKTTTPAKTDDKSKKDDKNKKTPDIEDEYYDLEGF